MTAQHPVARRISLILLAALHLCAGGLVARIKRQANLPPPSFNGSSDVTDITASLPPEGSPTSYGCLGEQLCALYHCSNGGRCLFFNNCTYACQCADGSLNWNLTCTKASSTPSESSGPLQEQCPLQCGHGRCLQEGESYLCDCDPGWTGVLCTDGCSLKCENGGLCAVGNDGEQFCNCEFPWQGVLCEQPPPPPPPDTSKDTNWIYPLAGGLAAGFLVMVSLFLFIVIYMWRHRYVIIMKVVFYFLPYEDNDGKMFDAFVSYRSSPEDLEFVYGMLTPRLEQDLKFKLCLHERDFLVGETIANNIVWAVENSRRTILVLSPSYLESEWTRLEYQKAQHEMLKRKQRIIPIMFRDIGEHMEGMDKTLKTILQSVTYLDLAKAAATSDEHRVDKFWKRLLLSMPKKKDTPDHTLASGHDSLSPSAPVPRSGLQTSSGKVSVVSDGKEGLNPPIYTPYLLREGGGEQGKEKKGGVQLMSVRFIRDGKDGFEENSERSRALEEVARSHELKLDTGI